MIKRISKIVALLVAFGLVFAFSVGSIAQEPPVVGISTGSSGTSWRNIMIAALEEVGNEYKAAGKIADYKIVINFNINKGWNTNQIYTAWCKITPSNSYRFYRLINRSCSNSLHLCLPMFPYYPCQSPR
jgi:hypothetical protein